MGKYIYILSDHQPPPRWRSCCNVEVLNVFLRGRCRIAGKSMPRLLGATTAGGVWRPEPRGGRDWHSTIAEGFGD